MSLGIVFWNPNKAARLKKQHKWAILLSVCLPNVAEVIAHTTKSTPRSGATCLFQFQNILTKKQATGPHGRKIPLVRCTETANPNHRQRDDDTQDMKSKPN